MGRMRFRIAALSVAAIGWTAWGAPPPAVVADDGPPTQTYHDGYRYVVIFAAPDTLNLVLRADFSGDLPADIAQHAFDQHGRHVFVRPPDSDAARRYFEAHADVERVQDVFYSTATGRRIQSRAARQSLTAQIAIRIRTGDRIDLVLRDVIGLWPANTERVRYSPDTYIVDTPPDDTIRMARELWESGRVVFAVPLFERAAFMRDFPNDPLFDGQWHLLNKGDKIGGTKKGADVKAADAWELSLGDAATIAVVDDGVEWTHADLAENYAAAGSWDFNDRDDDPMPDCADGHGTAVAGVAAAVGDNGIGVIGVAPNATLSALRLTAAPFGDDDFADAITYREDLNNIYTNSWGPADDGRTIEGPGALGTAALEFGARAGRGGLGNIYVWAGGNGGLDDNANFDGYVNSRYTIGVGATTDRDIVAPYSEPGACLLVNAPSSGGHRAITTTDPTGQCGEDLTDYRTDFVGTSAAAPMVAGVVALMLDVNPELTWRDVQTILVHTASKNDRDDPGWNVNGAGLLVHHRYGFGRVNGYLATLLASVWSNLPHEIQRQWRTDLPRDIPDDDPNGTTVVFEIADRFVVEQVDVHLVIEHPRRSDLELRLTSPSGTQSTLATRRPDDDGADLDWTFTTVHSWGELSNGEWRLNVRDLASGSSGKILSCTVTIGGGHLVLTPGDMNADGELNIPDIGAFVLALTDRDRYIREYPGIDPDLVGDMNGNGQLDLEDIGPFIDAILNEP